MEIDKNDNAGSVEYKGNDYYFCSPGCKDKFEENPEKYINNDEHDKEHNHH